MAWYLHETGYRKAVKLENRNEIVQVMANYHTLVKVKAQIDQFLDGLRSLLIDEEIQRYPELMQPLFVPAASKKLTAGRCEIVCYDCFQCTIKIMQIISNSSCIKNFLTKTARKEMTRRLPIFTLSTFLMSVKVDKHCFIVHSYRHAWYIF